MMECDDYWDKRQAAAEEAYQDSLRDAEYERIYEDLHDSKYRESIQEQILKTYEEEKDFFGHLFKEIQGLKKSNFGIAYTTLCLILIESLSRKIIVTSFFKGMVSYQIKEENPLTKLIVDVFDRNIKPTKFVIDFLNTLGIAEQSDALSHQLECGIKQIKCEKSSLYCTTPPQSWDKWFEKMNEYRNKIAHGRIVPDTTECQFIELFLNVWLRLLGHILESFDIKANNGFQLERISNFTGR